MAMGVLNEVLQYFFEFQILQKNVQGLLFFDTLSVWSLICLNYSSMTP